MTCTTRDEIVAYARTWVGVPFRHQGRSRAGIDCVGMTVMIAAEMGITGVDVGGYTRRSYGPALLEPFDKHCKRLPFQQAQPGDIIIFYDNVYPVHVGILANSIQLIGSRTVIHAVATLRQVAETPWEGEWRSKARLAYSFPGIK